ncbi:MAG: TetR/AcrR family transcriptional regulator [Candidatus Binatia bacterium]
METEIVDVLERAAESDLVPTSEALEGAAQIDLVPVREVLERAAELDPVPTREALQRAAARDRVPTREALLKAAAALFAERGAEAVSTREIASRAKVNNGLIHRHFRTKDALLREVLEGLSSEIASLDQRGDETAVLLRFFNAIRERETYWRLLARTMLDGQPVDRLQRTFPTMDRVIELIGELQAQGRGPADADPRTVAALVGAVAFGWLVFEPWLLAAGGFSEEEKEAAGRDVIRLIRDFLSHPQA